MRFYINIENRLPGFCSKVHRDLYLGGLFLLAFLLVRRFDTRQNRPWPWPRRRRPCRRRRASWAPRRSRLWSICLNQLIKKLKKLFKRFFYIFSYKVFQGFEQAKFAYNVLILGSSQFTLKCLSHNSLRDHSNTTSHFF